MKQHIHALTRRLSSLLAALSLFIAVSSLSAADDSAKADPIAGRWRWVNNDIVTILPDGTASCPSVGTAT